jgi:inosine-uridine nucleoside N-ribohydrolase
VGRDIDDTCAILTLCASPELELVGVVTCGGDSENRAKIVRGWLRRLGIQDDACPVGVGSDLNGLSEEVCRCVVTKNLFSASQDLAEDFHFWEGGGHDLILNMALKYGKSLSIIAIGPLRALRDAVLADRADVLNGIGGFFFQGNAKISDEGLLTPDPIAYNISVGTRARRRGFTGAGGGGGELE